MCLKRAPSLSFFLFFFFYGLSSYSQEVFTAYLVINEIAVKDPVWVEYFAPEQNSVLHLKSALESLKGQLSDEFTSKIEKTLSKEGKVRIKDLIAATSAEVKVDLDSLNIVINVAAKDKKTSSLSLVSLNRDKKNVLHPKFFSGYFNVRASSNFSGEKKVTSSTRDFDTTHNLSLENIFNFGGLVLENQFNYSNEIVTGTNRWNRAYSRMIYNDENYLVRYTLGDLKQRVRGFQDVVFGAGFNMSKEFTIDPNFFRSSIRKYKFFLDSRSRVEIFVNGALLKVQEFPQGPVELSNFPFNAGENEVRIRVTDAFGKIRFLDFSEINDSRLLATGVSDFNLSYFYPRSDQSQGISFKDNYDFSTPIVSGYYSRGVAQDLVLGLDLLYKKDYSLLGIEAIYGDGDGIVKSNLAYSKNQNKQGGAARLEYENYLFKAGKAKSLRFIASASYYTKDFLKMNLIPQNINYSIQASIGQNLQKNIRGSFGVLSDFAFDSNSSRTYLNSNFGWTFWKNFDFTANVRVNLDNSKDSFALLSLNWYSSQNNQQLISVYDPINNTSSAEYLAYPLNGAQNFRAFASGELTDFSERASLGLDYFNQRAAVRLSQSFAFADQRSLRQSTQLNFGTALAFTQNSISISRPINNSFALLSMNNRPKGEAIPIGRGLKYSRGEINFWGPAVVTNLAPYYTDRLDLNIKTLPYGYTLETENFRIRPTYKSGVSTKVKLLGSVALSGKVLFANLQPASYISGYMYRLNRNQNKTGKEHQFFTGEDGSFDVEDLERGDYLLEFEAEDRKFKSLIIRVHSSIGIEEISQPIILKEL